MTGELGLSPSAYRGVKGGGEGGQGNFERRFWPNRTKGSIRMRDPKPAVTHICGPSIGP